MKSDTGKRMSGTGDLFGRKLKNSPNPKRLKNSPVDPYKKDMTPKEMRFYDELRTTGLAQGYVGDNTMTPSDARELATTPSGRLRPINPQNHDGISDFERLKEEVAKQRKSKKK